MKNNEIMATNNGGDIVQYFNSQEIQTIKTTLCKGISDQELMLFGRVCKRTGLDPFARQIYAITRSGRMTIQTSIDGFRVIAQRSGSYNGQEGPFWCGDDGVWRDVWLSKKAPCAAKVGVYRKGAQYPITGIALWEEYAQGFKGSLSAMWSKMPTVMLAKCAEAIALRKAFPQDLSGIYTSDEMDQADSKPGVVEVVPSQTESVVVEQPTNYGKLLIDLIMSNSEGAKGKEFIEFLKDFWNTDNINSKIGEFKKSGAVKAKYYELKEQLDGK